MKDTSDIINRISQDWLEEFVIDLQDLVRSKLPADTGTGASDINARMIRATISSGATIMIDMQDYLRLFDMRRVERSKDLNADGMDRLRKWVKRKGVQSFLKGYKYPTTVTKGGVTRAVPEARIINNIVWGISRKRRKLKRRRWYNQHKGNQVYSLYGRLLAGVGDSVLEQVKGDVKGQ